MPNYMSLSRGLDTLYMPVYAHNHILSHDHMTPVLVSAERIISIACKNSYFISSLIRYLISIEHCFYKLCITFSCQQICDFILIFKVFKVQNITHKNFNQTLNNFRCSKHTIIEIFISLLQFKFKYSLFNLRSFKLLFIYYSHKFR